MRFCALKVLESLRNDLYAKIIRLPIEFYDRNRVGFLMSRIINDVDLIRNSIPELIMIVRHALTMIALLFVVFYRDAYLATWAIIILPLALFPLVYLGKKLRKLARKNQKKIADISSILQEIFSCIRVIKAFATEKGETKRFFEQNAKLVKIALKGAFYDATSSPLMEFIGSLGIGLVIWYGGSQVIAGNSTPGTFFSFMTALLMLYEPFKKISKSNLAIQRALAGAERVFEILDSEQITEERGGDRAFPEKFQELGFENTTFYYPHCQEAALKQINLTVHAGEKLAIVGPSGSGKSTLVNLIPRFFLPQEGKILLNGLDLNEYSLSSLRRSIGMVSQEAFLFNTSIRENIAYGLTDVEQNQLEKVCQAAYAHDFITALPQGYETVIGERGTKLSGGQKQRLTIGRALLKDPPLLILDEATSALDTEAERIVQKALENLMQDRTSIVIAHRLSTVLSADRIVVMEQGRIVDIGTHEQLLHYCSLYKKLYDMQFQE
jgi:subfamily B ATP-binding cassette protein MsbA